MNQLKRIIYLPDFFPILARSGCKGGGLNQNIGCGQNFFNGILKQPWIKIGSLSIGPSQ